MKNVIKLLNIINDNYCFEIDENIENEILLFMTGLIRDHYFRIIENNCRKDNALDLLGIGYIKIMSNIYVYKGNEKEGIYSNDIIINGNNFKNGNTITFLILRNGKLIEKKYEKPIINKMDNGNDIVISKNTIYLKIRNFSESYNEMINKINEKNKKIIIDLRDNMGGNAALANNFLKMFVRTVNPVYFVNNIKQGEKAIYYRNNKCVFNNNKVYVLVNEYTASSAELATSVLKEHNNAQVIGRKTYGKGVMLKRLKFTQTKDILLPVYEFYTKSVKINNKGIFPDIVANNQQMDDWIYMQTN